MPGITRPDRSDAPARHLGIRSRAMRDRIRCADHDLITEKAAARRYLHRDGTPHPQGAKNG